MGGWVGEWVDRGGSGAGGVVASVVDEVLVMAWWVGRVGGWVGGWVECAAGMDVYGWGKEGGLNELLYVMGGGEGGGLNELLDCMSFVFGGGGGGEIERRSEWVGGWVGGLTRRD